MLSGPHSRLPAHPALTQPSPTEPTVWVLPRPEVRPGTVHFWKSCWKTADSAPSFCTSTCVFGGYCLAFMKFWEERGWLGLCPASCPHPTVQAKAWLLPQTDPTMNLPLVPSPNPNPTPVLILTLPWLQPQVQTRPSP